MTHEKHEDEQLSLLFAQLQGSERDREEAVRQLDRLMGRKIERYFIRHKVPEQDAEELVWDVWLKLLSSVFRGETRPAVWIWVIARSILVSFHRRERPEISFDDDGWDALLSTHASSHLPEWVRICIERALFQFEQDHPERTEILRMVAEEWSAREIGKFLGCNEGAARDRVFRTRERVRGYLEECVEGA